MTTYYNENDPRAAEYVCSFSCGAASAVATKLMLQRSNGVGVIVVNAFVAEEHPDNRRFAADCEQWFGAPIMVVKNERYSASCRAVFRERRYIKGVYGAPCSGLLKRELIEPVIPKGAKLVLGYTIEEKKRAERLGRDCVFPLIDAELTHSDCLSIVARAGIELPMMYRLGFNNANCIGCPKGGMGYWNKVRELFPGDFAEMASIERELGESAYLFCDRKTGIRFPLDELPPDAGKHKIKLPECSLFCEAVEEELS